MKLESVTEKSLEECRGIDMNSPQLESSSADPVTPEQEQSSAVLGTIAAIEGQVGEASNLVQKHINTDVLNSKTRSKDMMNSINANDSDAVITDHAHDYSPAGTVTTEVRSAEEPGSKTVKTSRQPVPLLDLNVKVKDSLPQTVQQSFNEAQQCQLRTQILVYGSLIEGTLPGEALMGVAFADISKVTRVESWDEYVKTSKSIWEKVWQTAAMRLQRSATIAGATWPVNQNSPLNQLTSSLKSSVTATTSSQLFPNNDSFASYLPTMKSKTSREGSLKKSSLRGSKSAPPNNSTLPAGIFSPPPPPNCTSTGWNLSLSGKAVTQNIQVSGNHTDLWEARGGPFNYSQHGPCSTPTVSVPWVTPYSSPECWAAPLFPTALPVGHGALMHSETLSVSNSVNGYLISQYPPSVPATANKHPLASFFPAASGSNGAAIDIVTSKDKAGTRKSEKQDPNTKRRKESGGNKNAANCLLAPSFADNSLSPSGRLKHASNALPITADSMTEPVISTALDLGLEKDKCADLVRSSSNDTEIILPVVSSVAAPTMSVSPNVIISQEVATLRECSPQSTATFLEQAKLNAQAAASSADLAMQQSQTIWNHITQDDFDDDQKAQVASSATAIAAAASVAKAAAAAAKLAYEAAVQAAALVNEAAEHTSGGTADTGSIRKEDASDISSSSQRVEEPEKEKGASGKWQFPGSSTSIISAAKAKVKKQIIYAAAATKRAQNLESAVQAAELAVEAAWQVGAVVAMGDPLPMTLEALKEAGMENYWKMGLSALEKELGDVHGPRVRETPAETLNEDYVQETSKRRYNKKSITRVSRSLEDSGKVNRKAGKTITKQKLLKRKKEAGEVNINKKVQKFRKAKAVQAKEQIELSPTKVLTDDMLLLSQQKQVDLNIEPDQIVEGSTVEVVPDEDGLHGVWFSAKVLRVNDSQVLVLYDELLADDGKSHLQEWIPLKSNDALKHGAPRVRLAHPILKDEASRKRRRSALGNQLWVIGDHVDAWMRDGWWEGVIMSISEEDENKVTVFFPGDGDRQVIKSWNLRPSLVWKDGSWISYTGGHKEGHPQWNQTVETNASILPNEGNSKGRSAIVAKNRSAVPSLNRNKIAGEHEMTVTTSASKRRKLLGIKRKTKKDGGLTGKLKKKILRASYSTSHGDVKPPSHENIGAESRDFSEDMMTIPDNQSLKQNKDAPYEETLSTPYLSSNTCNRQPGEPQSLTAVAKTRKYQKKTSKTMGENFILEPNNL